MLFIRGSNNRYRVADEDDVIFEALQIYNRYFSKGEALTDPDKAKDCIKLKLAPLEHEVFLCVFLDNQHKVIACEELFRGTIDGASVYPREVVKTALRHNAAALIFAHNHPSGISEPSQADRVITEKLKTALALIEIRVLDHFVVGESVYSFAEHGLL
ncbi:RadC family protein [Methylomonas koyamae]|uniref:RadC family protein n=1 Tax=Methylomonas koyamae TaxID=702114 RepID=UPI000BC2E42B|nr:DNA repair protein RadC [Methylomonas koyamae]ATG88320.1 DNA repair protein [Methylomonas koyamae]